MDALSYIKLFNSYKSLKARDFKHSIRIRLITNFTDDILQKLLTGICIHNGIYPHIETVPYKQYHLYLKNPKLHSAGDIPDITFVFFDINSYFHSEFHADKEHVKDMLETLHEYCHASKGTVILTTSPIPYRGAYGNLYKESSVYKMVESYHQGLSELSEELKNAYVLDINPKIHEMGEKHVRDLRGLYAFDMPFTSAFNLLLCEEWFAYIRMHLGKIKKGIVVDLDNILWGGIVGESGPLGVKLGPTYPGNAFQNFQRALLEFSRRGVVLSINSRNNPKDVMEVFEKNPHMVLKPENFAVMKINWKTKAQNLAEIVQELNVGLDSLVFIDDDPVNRDMVRTQLPDVFVPDFSLSPEEYVRELYSWNVFHQLSLTQEDRQKSQMYAQENERKALMDSVRDTTDYIAQLNIVIDAQINDANLIPRIAQLTQKTNQCNLTTKRYSEDNIQQMISKGYLVYTGSVHDRFGDYGTVALAIIKPSGKKAKIDSFLMSCRVMGRGVEHALLNWIIKDLEDRGIVKLEGQFIPSAKNPPAKDFLPEMGFVCAKNAQSSNGEAVYKIGLSAYLAETPQIVNRAITVRGIKKQHKNAKA